MGLALVSALLLPPDLSNAPRGTLDAAFAPLTIPVRQVSAWAQKKTGTSTDKDAPAAVRQDHDKTPEQLRDEVEALRASLSEITSEVNHLREENRRIAQMGQAGRDCRSFQVLFSDAGQRQSIGLRASKADGVLVGQAVLTPDCLIGQITAVGVGGAQVRLTTDRECSMRVSFGRFEGSPEEGGYRFVPVRTERQPISRGIGNNEFEIANLDLRDVQAAKLVEGDWVVLSDDDWPRQLQGYPLGRIKSIGRQRKAPLFAQITAAPRLNLSQLPNAMVMLSSKK